MPTKKIKPAISLLPTFGPTKSLVAPANTDPRFEKIIALLFKDAEEAKAAGTHDGDIRYDLLIAQAQCFRAGLNKELPPQWKRYAEELARLEDHEYQIYLRLKKKYEGK